MDVFSTPELNKAAAADREGGGRVRPEWEALHEEACRRGEHFYPDPETGLWVGTRVRLLARGHCCGNGCRHCPYDGE